MCSLINLYYLFESLWEIKSGILFIKDISRTFLVKSNTSMTWELQMQKWAPKIEMYKKKKKKEWDGALSREIGDMNLQVNSGKQWCSMIVSQRTVINSQSNDVAVNNQS